MPHKNPHAQALGRLGGRKKGTKLSADHQAKILANLAKARHAYREQQAARVMALAADEHGAMLAARRTIDNHAPQALARQTAAAESEPRTTFQGRQPACTAPVFSSAAGRAPSPRKAAPIGDSGTEAVRVTPGSQPAPRSTSAGPGTTHTDGRPGAQPGNGRTALGIARRANPAPSNPGEVRP